jgi:NADPH2:quinone reductase
MSLPKLMRAAAVDRFGPPSRLAIHHMPVPTPGPNEVVMALHTAGVGSWDVSIRDGSWRRPGRPKFPLVPGTDGSGVVVASGSRVRRLRVGDRVYAYEFGNAQGGFYAEFAAVDARHAGRVPKRLGLREAGAAAATGLTALQGIDLLAPRRGETLLVFGASGSVGTMAVQFAVARGARVLATASGAAATRLIRRLGAREIIDARSPHAVEQLRKASGDGIDAVLALAGGEQLERCLDFVRRGGRVAHPNGVEPEPADRPTFRVRTYDAVASPAAFAKLTRHLSRSTIRVPLAGSYPLARAADAHRRVEAGRIIGRLVLKIRNR